LEIAATCRIFRAACLLHALQQPKEQVDRLRHSPDCAHILAGTWTDPAVLDGNWNDRSSQLAVSRVFGRPRLERDLYVRGHPLAVHLDPEADLFLSRGLQHENDHDVGASTRIQDGEVHVMMVPWSIDDGPDRKKFMVTGLGSC